MMDKYEEYKKRYLKLINIDPSYDQKGGYTVIKPLGKGHSGQAYVVEIDDKEFVLKKQKTSEEMYNNKSTTNPIIRELDFYDWIKTLDESNAKFFCKIKKFDMAECDFNFVPIRGSLPDDILKSKYCAEFIMEKKDGTVNSTYNELDNSEILSVFVQLCYTICLMHKNGYYHMDAKLDNIFWEYTNDSVIRLGKFGKIKSHGKHFGLIDYGNVINAKFSKTDFEKKLKIFVDPQTTNIMLGADIYNLIDYLLLDITNVCDQIEKDKIGFSPKDILLILKHFKREYSKKYLKVQSFCQKKLMFDADYLKSIEKFLESDGEYERFKKDFHMRAIAYEMIQIMHIFYQKNFYQILYDLFKVKITNSHKIDKSHLITIKKYHNKLSKIIKYIMTHFF